LTRFSLLLGALSTHSPSIVGAVRGLGMIFNTQLWA
jgi:hypothetical protein